MAFFSFEHVKISGISVVVPPKEICIYDEAEYYENNEKKIDRLRKKVGFYKRRVIDKDVTATDLAINACTNLIDKMNIDKNSIDALIYVVQNNDYLGPMDSYLIHHKLGLSSHCFCTNLQQGCAGWVYGLQFSSNLVELGKIKRLLLVNGDIPSTGLDINDRNQAPIFGDAGCATLLEYTRDITKSFYDISTYSDGYESIIIPGFGKKLSVDASKSSEDPFNKPLFTTYETGKGFQTNLRLGTLDGETVFEFTMNKVPQDIKRTVENVYGKFDPDEFSYCCLHQANKQIVQTIGTLINFPLDKVPYKAFEYYGNNTMCSIPTTLLSIHDDTQKFNKKPYLCSAFGNGFVTATAILDLSDTFYCGISNFEKPSDWLNREQTFKFWIDKIHGN